MEATGAFEGVSEGLRMCEGGVGDVQEDVTVVKGAWKHEER